MFSKAKLLASLTVAFSFNSPLTSAQIGPGTYVIRPGDTGYDILMGSVVLSNEITSVESLPLSNYHAV